MSEVSGWEKRRCTRCELNRARRFFTSDRGRVCVTCQKKTRKASSRAGHLRRTYCLSEELYAILYKAQGGKCAICQRATGKSKRLAVDHDHRCCPGKESCGKCVTGLLCGPCNVGVLGHLRRSTEALERAILVVRDMPAQKILKDHLGIVENSSYDWHSSSLSGDSDEGVSFE